MFATALEDDSLCPFSTINCYSHVGLSISINIQFTAINLSVAIANVFSLGFLLVVASVCFAIVNDLKVLVKEATLSMARIYSKQGCVYAKLDNHYRALVRAELMIHYLI